MMRNKKVVINASNLHVGGGVQVASSFLNELAELILDGYADNLDISVLVSDKVNENITCDTNTFQSYRRSNVFGFKDLSIQDIFFIEEHDICFTVFGPFYYQLKKTKNICGFAQPWIAYPNNDAYHMLTVSDKIKSRIKYFVQSLYFKKSDHIIVEQEHVKSALTEQGYKSDSISVVSNCISSVFDEPGKWKELDYFLDIPKESFKIGFLGRSYFHKNIKILNDVERLLREKYSVDVAFVFTFTEAEMESLGFNSNGNFYTVGGLSVEQCPAFYNYIDALVFPSLLECFSATPIEAMKMGVPVFSSKYPFVESVCKDAAFYFDALSPDDIARVINESFASESSMQVKIRLGNDLSKLLPTSVDRAKHYLKIINEVGEI